MNQYVADIPPPSLGCAFEWHKTDPKTFLDFFTQVIYYFSPITKIILSIDKPESRLNVSS
jgi:hypothetical protein